MPKPAKSSADYILPLDMNGLKGRMLRLPARGKHRREILLIYGHHAMLERWLGLAENLNSYGNVTMPDLPGFGGMENFHKVGTKPTIDAFADYLAAFAKLRYRRSRFTIIAVSYGFVVATRMLQRYPDIAKRTDALISLVGLMHTDDLDFEPLTKKAFRGFARVLATRPVALLIRYLFLNKFVLKHIYAKMPNSRRRMIEVTPDEFDRSMDFEVRLWQANDVRTHWLTSAQLMKLDNCRQPVPLPVIHVASANDHYLNNIVVEQHMRQVFSDYRRFTTRSKAHVPSVIADKKAMGVLLPAGVRRILSRKS